ncbi:glycosyltransferase family 4 protein [Epilithonimonas hungarica]|uniref:Glycosyltransferase involved in cell wall bisynthesis n=1 Tax=Epilithonimonas hungarica TaxID=454006 RepID=A0A1G7GIG8_9FLAO|nr:glycosyltransferase family 4 protein [Epilithonimonas hungarica]SDE87873.1 Glycosyltransferase involved in cell wall bisynthesis [Epilithonimonas hungarica]
MKKLIRISTVPSSLNILLKGQLQFLNHYFNVISVSGSGLDLDEVKMREGVNIHPIEMQRHISPLRDLVALIKLFLYFRKEKPDIIHSLTPKAGLLSMIAGKLAGVPVRMHTFTGLIFPYRTGKMQKTLILMDRLLCVCATNIYPEGQGVKNDLLTFNITKKPLIILANGNINGIDADFFYRNVVESEGLIQLKKDLDILDEDFVFTFVGRLVKDKGINELVSAFKMFSERKDTGEGKPKLLLVGSFEQNLDPVSEETLFEIENNENIITTGFQKDVRPYLAISDVLTFPSYREGFPNVVLQAAAMELNAIVTDISGSNEIICDGLNGWIIPKHNQEQLYEKMKWCLENISESKAMGKKSRTIIIERYEQKIVWEALKAEYFRLSNN